MNDKQITIKDDKGKEITFNILFTFEENSNKYVLCYEDGNEDTIIPFKYDESGNAYTVDDKDELELIQQYIDSYDDEGNEDEKDN